MKAIHSDGLFRDWLGDLMDEHLRSTRSPGAIVDGGAARRARVRMTRVHPGPEERR